MSASARFVGRPSESKVLHELRGLQWRKHSFARQVGRRGEGVRVEGCGWSLGCARTSGTEGLEDVSTIFNKQDCLEVVEKVGSRGGVHFLSVDVFDGWDAGLERRRRAWRRRSFAEVGGGVKVNKKQSDFRGEVDGGKEEVEGGENFSQWAISQVELGTHVSGFEYGVMLFQQRMNSPEDCVGFGVSAAP